MSCTATDATGNVARTSFIVTVRGADAQLGAMRAGAAATACRQIGAFVNEVDAQAGKAIGIGDAAVLIPAATPIRAVLSCL